MTDISTALSEINVALPGQIVAYDAGAVRAIVRPSIPKRLANGEVLAAPQIINVPVMFPMTDIRGQVAQVTLPVKSGDGCLLIFSHRSLENWLSGSQDAPDDPRMFDLSDAFCVMGGNSRSPNADPENLCIQYGEGAIKLTPGGDLIIQAKTTTITADSHTINGDVTLNGAMTATGDVKAGSISLQTHKHTGDSGGKTGVPE